MMDTTKKLVFDQKIKFLDQSKARDRFPVPDNVFPGTGCMFRISSGHAAATNQILVTRILFVKTMNKIFFITTHVGIHTFF